MVRPLIGGFVSLLVLVQNLSAFQAENSILYFQSAQCEPCREQEKSLAVVQQQGWTIHKIDAPAQLEVARRYQITNLPTLIVLAGNQEVDRLVGLVGQEQLQLRLKRVAARSSSSAPAPSANRAASSSTSRPLAAARSVPNEHNLQAPRAPLPNQPIVRGQSPDSAEMAFPRLANNDVNRDAARSAAAVTAAAPANLFQDWPSSGRDAFSQGKSTAPGFHADSSAPAAGQSHAHESPQASSQSDIAHAAVKAEPISLERAMSRAADATVRIKVEEPKSIAHGTGTIVAVHGTEALVLTCGHMFRDMLPGSQLTVDLFAGTPRQVNLVAQLIDFKADKEDIGLLAVRLPVKIEPVPILPKSELLQKGQAAFSMGCDHGNNPTRRDTKISNINRYMGPANVEIVGAPATGRSGGGLFDSQGRLIGVCNAASNEDNEGIYAAAEVIYAQLARIDHGHLFEPKPQLTLASSNPESPDQSTLATTVAAQQSTAGGGWPDEDPRLERAAPGTSSLGSNTTTANPQASSSAAATRQLICILKDATGNDKVVSIDQPSVHLLQAIEQQGTIKR